MQGSLSRKILIALIVMFVLSWLPALGRPVFALFALTPERIVPDLELWRLVTHPFAVGGGLPLALLFGAITFGAPADEVESMIGTRTFAKLLLAVAIGTAVVHTLLFFGSGVPLAGPANITLFALLGFVYLFPHSEVRLIFFGVRGWILLTFILAVLLSITIYQTVQGASLFAFFSSGGFGLIFGAVYFHARYQKYPILLRPIRTVERVISRDRSDGAWRASPTARKGTGPQPVRLRMPFQKAQPREMSDEERLNNLLDRISAKGYSDLSEEEQAFLRDYSGRL